MKCIAAHGNSQGHLSQALTIQHNPVICPTADEFMETVILLTVTWRCAGRSWQYTSVALYSVEHSVMKVFYESPG